MNFDRYDLLTISFGSAGSLLGSFVGFALESEYIGLFLIAGAFTGVAFAIGAVESSQSGARSASEP